MTTTPNFLTDEDMSILESNADIIRFQADDTIFNLSKPNTGIYWVRSGVVRVELSRLYKNVTIAGIGEGQMFGEMSFLMDDHLTTTTIVAHTDTEVMFLDRTTMENLLDEHQGLAARFYKTAAITLAHRLRNQTKKS